MPSLSKEYKELFRFCFYLIFLLNIAISNGFPESKPCEETKYKCCSDGVSPAAGLNNEGCPAANCSETLYGCCSDNTTVAEGYDQEGCPKPASACEISKQAEAKGPKLKGCDCSTYQFEHCLDGNTVAKGPQQQGCECIISEFRCCGDGNTAAKGPSELRCDCSTSQYGCCPDGVTEAKGRRFLNCTDVPEIKQAACSLLPSRGSCSNFSVKWFYDMQYGGCSRFWYGGCEGNGNRFETLSDCEDVCVQPSSKDACNLPMVRGSCNDLVLRWYYDSSQEECLQFEYGGCLGNANKFLTRESCQKQCGPALEHLTADQCSLPMERGPCAGTFGRWGYRPESGRCEQFTWGGCEGNPNRFDSEAACMQRCVSLGFPESKPCEETKYKCCSDGVSPAAGLNNEGCPAANCNETLYGCCSDNTTVAEGNDQEGCPKPASACETSQCCEDGKTAAKGPSELRCDCSTSQYGCCPDGVTEAKGRNFLNCTDVPEIKQAACSLLPSRGSCSNFSVEWFYDMQYGGCSRFWYGGCEGNGNRFETLSDCEDVCVQPSPKDACNLPMVRGSCNDLILRWYYDSSQEQCLQFEYGGCLGNANKFLTRESCQKQCGPALEHLTADQCSLPMERGPCAGTIGRWGYRPESGRCEQFTWGGCEGNLNRFDSEAACMQRCVSPGFPESKPCEDTKYKCCSDGVSPAAGLNNEGCPAANCSETLYGCCSDNTTVAEGNDQEGCPKPASACETSQCCGDGKTAAKGPDELRCDCSTSQYGCCPDGVTEAKGRNFLNCTDAPKIKQAACSLLPSRGSCSNFSVEWYYDMQYGGCSRFWYGGCEGNGNRFETLSDCEDVCVQPSSKDACNLPMVRGSCNELILRWYYDSSQEQCLQFEYGGCLGNANNFLTKDSCQKQCGPALEHLTADQCSLPMERGPCAGTFGRWGYRPESGRCEQFTWGGCKGNPNRFDSEAACMQRCVPPGQP